MWLLAAQKSRTYKEIRNLVSKRATEEIILVSGYEFQTTSIHFAQRVLLYDSMISLYATISHILLVTI